MSEGGVCGRSVGAHGPVGVSIPVKQGRPLLHWFLVPTIKTQRERDRERDRETHTEREREREDSEWQGSEKRNSGDEIVVVVVVPGLRGAATSSVASSTSI